MSDDNDRRSLARRGKPLVYGEIIISEPIYVQQLAVARAEGRAAGYAEAIEECAKRAWQLTIDKTIASSIAKAHGQDGVTAMMKLGDRIASELRAIAPAAATTKEPT